jgi:ribosome-associated protein
MSNDTPLSANFDDDNPQDLHPEEPAGPDNYVLEEGEVDTETLARDITRLTWDLKALNTRAIDLRGRVSYTDFVIVSTATADRHVQAIAKHVLTSLAAAGFQPLGTEGLDSGKWALVDFGDVVLHVFNGDVRDEYDLERMWPDAPLLEFDDAPEDLYGHFETQRF